VTCIIGTRAFICGDRRVASDDGTKYAGMRKLARNDFLITGSAGLASDVLAVRAAVKRGARTPADLVAAVGKESYCLVLTRAGRLFLVSPGEWCPVKEPYCIGTGDALALGFMHGATRFSVEVARRAQRFVARNRIDCGDGSDVLSLLT
jgi:hypothetical protein